MSREHEKCRSELASILKETPENRHCADCGATQPTWTSTNLGVFVCIRCAGFHRRLGVHISKVKSTTLDAWTMKLLKEFKAQGGNKEVNAKYEAKLDSSEKPTPATDSYVLEQFIRSKYQQKKWYREHKKKPKKHKKDKDEKRRRSKTKPKSLRNVEPEQYKPKATPTSSPEPTRTTRVVKQVKPKSKPTKPKEIVPDLLSASQLQNLSLNGEPVKKSPEDFLDFDENLNQSIGQGERPQQHVQNGAFFEDSNQSNAKENIMKKFQPANPGYAQGRSSIPNGFMTQLNGVNQNYPQMGMRGMQMPMGYPMMNPQMNMQPPMNMVQMPMNPMMAQNGPRPNMGGYGMQPNMPPINPYTMINQPQPYPQQPQFF